MSIGKWIQKILFHRTRWNHYPYEVARESVRHYGRKSADDLEKIFNKDAVLLGCYAKLVEEEMVPYQYGVYYFFPRGHMTEVEMEEWENDCEHCLSSASGLDRQQSIDYVQDWAMNQQGIKLSKKAIADAYRDHKI